MFQVADYAMGKLEKSIVNASNLSNDLTDNNFLVVLDVNMCR